MLLIFYTVVMLLFSFKLQINWSCGCRSHVDLMKEEQKCIEELQRLNSHHSTGCFKKNAHF